MSWTKERARVTSFPRSRTLDDPDPNLTGTSRDLRAAGIEEHVSRLVAAAPPLTAEQRYRVAQLLAPSITVGGGAA